MATYCFTEKAMAPHSSTLAWKIPWMEEPGGLQSMGSLRVRRDWATSLSLFTFMHWRRKWQPTPVFLPGESQWRWSLVGCIYGVAQSRTRLKRLSSSSRSIVSPGQLAIIYLTNLWPCRYFPIFYYHKIYFVEHPQIWILPYQNFFLRINF